MLSVRGNGSERLSSKVLASLSAQSEIGVCDVGEEKLERSADNRSVIVNSVIDRSGSDVRRDQNRRDAHAQASEVKRRVERICGIAGPDLAVWIHGGGWRHMIVESAVLIVNNHQEWWSYGPWDFSKWR